MQPATFRALVVEVAADGAVQRSVRPRKLDDLTDRRCADPGPLFVAEL